MLICQSISSISRLGAGVSGFVLPLSQNLANNNVKIEVLSLQDSYCSLDLSLWQPLKPILLKCHIKFFGYSTNFVKALDNIHPCLIHQHGLWMYPSLAVLEWSIKFKIPRIVSSHGMLASWAWKHNNWKKKPIWYLWEKHNLQTATAIHVTSEQEMNSVRKMGIKSPIAIIPIGIDVPELLEKKIEIKKTILFLSRIHPVKGIENLIYAWQQVKRDDWQIIITGSGEQDYLDLLSRLVQKLGLDNNILFYNAVYGDEKWQLIANSDLFVLPSFSENFGIVIAEALACEVPVITTNATPWQGLLDHRCGWWIDIGVEPLAQALREAMQLSTDQRQLMGKRGKKYMEQSFNWQESALKMKALYEWALFKKEKPDFVYL